MKTRELLRQNEHLAGSLAHLLTDLDKFEF